MKWTTSGIPNVIDRLLELLADRAELVDRGVTVVDGLGNIVDTGDYLHIGVANPFASGLVSAASSDQAWEGATPDIRRENDGAVTCCAVCWDAGGDMKSARDRAFQIAGVVQQILREDIRLGGTIRGLIKTSFGGIEYDQDHTEDGALAVLVFRVGFQMNLTTEEG